MGAGHVIGILPLITFVVVLAFAQQVFARWWRRRDRAYLLIWSIGLLIFAVGSLNQALYALFGWQDGWGEINFRLWYISGAILVAAWLGQGTVFLLWRRIAWPTLGVLLVGSIVAIVLVSTATVDPAPLRQNLDELTGVDVLPSGTRLIALFFNVYGAAMLAGGAAWSAFSYWRRREHPNRFIGNVLIGLGVIALTAGGALNRFGFAGLYTGQLVGAVLMFVGFLATTREVAIISRMQEAAVPATD